MAVKSFMTNDLVKEHDMYVDFMKHRNDEITNGGDEPTEVLFYKKRIGGYSQRQCQRDYVAICKWHCITITYDIWYDICKTVYSRTMTSCSTCKTLVDIPEDALKKFKYRVERSISNAKCDFNKRIHRKRAMFDACRYLAMFWTYLDIVKDDKTQRLYPTSETRKRAAKIFGYDSGDDPFIMNGKFYNRKNKEVDENMPETDPYEIKIEDMMLTTRTFMCLKRTQHKTLGDILEMTIKDLMHVRNFGLRSLREVIETLNKYGYSYPINPDADPDAGPLKFYLTTATPIKAVVADIKKPEKKEKAKSDSDCDKLKKENEELKARIENLKGIHERNKELVEVNMNLEKYVSRLKDEVYILTDQKNGLEAKCESLNPSKFGLTDIIDLLIKRCKAERIPTLTMKYNNWIISIDFDGSFMTINNGDENKGWTIRTTKEDK